MAKLNFKDEYPHVIECELICNKDEYLNLDIEMNKLEKFSQKYLEAMEKLSNSAPRFKNAHERKKFFCTAYAKKFGIKIISFTFKYPDINTAGFAAKHIERKQICVTNNDNINILESKEV